jgi:hypothetical protein
MRFLKIFTSMLPVLFMFNSVRADTSFDAGQVWQQSQMTEAFMRKIDKWSCVEKTKMTLKAGCSKTEKCLKTMAGLFGDCLTYAKGDTGEFCEVFPKWRRQSCFKGEFDGRACVFFEIGEDSFCKGKESKSLQ